MKPIATTVNMPQNLVTRYRRLATSTGQDCESLMLQVLSEEIDRLEYEYGLLAQVEDYEAGRMKTYSLQQVREECGLRD